MANIFLTFYGDGPHWDNIIKIPAYPSETSYYRPFKYRDRWLQPELLNKIQNENGRESLIGENAFLCVRFISQDFSLKILPIRKAKITKIIFVPDNHSVYFTLGSMVNYSFYDDLLSACLSIPPEEQRAVQNYLMFYSDIQCHDALFCEPVHETEAWVHYSDLIARDETLPIRNDARSSLFIRFEVPESKDPAKIGVINRSKFKGLVYGVELRQGITYEQIVSHRVPYLISRNTTIRPFNYDITNNTDNIAVSPSREEMAGNYQTHVLSLFPRKPSGGWEEIILKPTGNVAAQDGTLINVHEISLPIKIKYNFWFEVKRKWMILLLVWLSLAASIILEGLLSINGNEGRLEIHLGVAFLTLITSIGIFVLQERGISIK